MRILEVAFYTFLIAMGPVVLFFVGYIWYVGVRVALDILKIKKFEF